MVNPSLTNLVSGNHVSCLYHHCTKFTLRHVSRSSVSGARLRRHPDTFTKPFGFVSTLSWVRQAFSFSLTKYLRLIEKTPTLEPSSRARGCHFECTIVPRSNVPRLFHSRKKLDISTRSAHLSSMSDSLQTGIESMVRWFYSVNPHNTAKWERIRA